MTRDAGAPPTLPVQGSGDFSTATGLYSAIVTGLYYRERTGRGTHVGTSLLAEGIWAAGTLVSGALAGGSSTVSTTASSRRTRSSTSMRRPMAGGWCSSRHHRTGPGSRM